MLTRILQIPENVEMMLCGRSRDDYPWKNGPLWSHLTEAAKEPPEHIKEKYPGIQQITVEMQISADECAVSNELGFDALKILCVSGTICNGGEGCRKDKDNSLRLAAVSNASIKKACDKKFPDVISVSRGRNGPYGFSKRNADPPQVRAYKQTLWREVYDCFADELVEWHNGWVIVCAGKPYFVRVIVASVICDLPALSDITGQARCNAANGMYCCKSLSKMFNQMLAHGELCEKKTFAEMSVAGPSVSQRKIAGQNLHVCICM
jgi:hypothetical protein